LTLLDVLVIALIQGLGEVLPLGTSGLLTSPSDLTGTDSARAAASVAIHLGILLALLLYFWRDVLAMGRGLWRLAKGKPDPGSRLMLHVAAGSIPFALVAGVLATPAATLVGPVGAASLILLGGLLLLACDRLGVTVHRIEHLTLPQAAGLGLTQVLALVPGVSRTGITISVARLLGWERGEAARFSLLLAIPLNLGAALFDLWRLLRQAQPILSGDLQLAALASGIIALIGIAVMMAWVGRHSYAPFALARIGLGIIAVLTALWTSFGTA